MDAQDSRFSDGSFDLACGLFGIMFFPDPVKAFAAMARVLKPRGRCAVTNWSGRERHRLLAPIAAAVNRVMPASPVAQALSAPSPLADPADLKHQLEVAGFHDVVITEASHTFRTSKEVYAQELHRSNPQGIQMMQRLHDQVGSRLRMALQDELEEQFGDGQVELTGVANIAVGFKLPAL